MIYRNFFLEICRHAVMKMPLALAMLALSRWRQLTSSHHFPSLLSRLQQSSLALTLEL